MVDSLYRDRWRLVQLQFDLWAAECAECKASHTRSSAESLRRLLDELHPPAKEKTK